MGKDISQIQKDMSELKNDVRSLVNARFATQNEVELKIAASQKSTDEKITAARLDIEEGMKTFRTISWSIFSAIILAIVYAFMSFVIKGGLN